MRNIFLHIITKKGQVAKTSTTALGRELYMVGLSYKKLREVIGKHPHVFQIQLQV